MFRSQYDTDVTVWSPQGRLLQVEYAAEAVKQVGALCFREGRVVVVVAEHPEIDRSCGRVTSMEWVPRESQSGAPARASAAVLEPSSSSSSTEQEHTCLCPSHDPSPTQGSACLGLVGAKHVILAALKRQPNELSSHQKKLLRIDEHVTVAIAGLNADARSLAKFMRTECLNHKYVYGAPLQAARLVVDVADKYQRCTQMYVRRPFGVGLLVASHDATGPHLYETSPTGTYAEWDAVAIGARSQSAKTYLEKHHASFASLSLDECVKHALKALAGCVAGDKELDAASASVAIVGLADDGTVSSTILEDDQVQPYLDAIDATPPPQEAAADGGGGDDDDAAMEDAPPGGEEPAPDETATEAPPPAAPPAGGGDADVQT
mmetsp:Transcript_25279/g.100747  ORF Transcript_25279/g.100747 Transcript_25279/m.100747 type:complete len:377 (+) Transcript_25279:82-1212(+)